LSLKTIRDEWMKDMDLSAADKARVWKKAEPIFRPAYEAYGENVLLCAMAYCEMHGKYAAEQIVAEAKRQYQAREDVKASEPEQYDQMEQTAVDPRDAWVQELRRAMFSYLRGHITVLEYAERVEDVLKRHGKFTGAVIDRLESLKKGA